MPGRIAGAWSWFIDGLVEAALWSLDRAGRAPVFRVEIDGESAAILAHDGAPIGRLTVGDTASFEPPEAARRLAGSRVDIVVPAGWLVRRELDAVAVQSRPFLDAFVRHQIERITPWRVGDTHYRVLQRPLAEDANRLAVAVAVMPKRLVARWLPPIEALHPRALRLRAAADPEGEIAIVLGGGRPRLAATLRGAAVWGLAASALLFAGVIATLEWQASLTQGEIADQDAVLAQRKAVLVRARQAGDPGGEASAKLRERRAARSLAVSIIDGLSAAVPDTAYLTALSIDKDHVVISGVSTDPSRLVPALETSGAFADVVFGAATTRVQSGQGDRFSLEMRALPPRSDHADAPPPSRSEVAPPGEPVRGEAGRPAGLEGPAEPPSSPMARAVP